MESKTVTLLDTDVYLPIDFLTQALDHTDDAERQSGNWTGKIFACPEQLARDTKENKNVNVKVVTSKQDHFLKIRFDKMVFNLRDDIYCSVIGELTRVLENIPPNLICETPKHTSDFSEDDRTVRTVDASVPDFEAQGENKKDHSTTDMPTADMSNHKHDDIYREPCAKILCKYPDQKGKRGRPRKGSGKSSKKVIHVPSKESQNFRGDTASTESESGNVYESPNERYSLRGKKIDPKIMRAEKGFYEQETYTCSKSANGNMTIYDFTDDITDFEQKKLLEKGVPQENKTFSNTKENNENIFALSNKKPWTKVRVKRLKDKFCKLCKYASSEYSRVLEHVKKKHKQEAGVLEYLQELETLQLSKCDLCNLEFHSESKLNMHIKKEHGNTTCNLCSQKFKNAVTLKNHIRNIHERTEDISAICEHCPASFKSFFSLKQHQESVHKDNKSFPCHMCSKRFINASQLRRHTRVHGFGAEKRLYCDICKKMFLYRHNLQRHMELIHSQSSKTEKYHCSYCGKGYTQKMNMISHVQHVHFNIFPYSCKQCKVTFPKSHFLLEHMMSVHKQTGVKIPESSRNQIYGKDDKDKFFCVYCNEGFLHKISLIEHMHFDHSKAFPYLCEHCSQGFLNKTFLALHSLKAHNILLTEDRELPISSIGTGDILRIISAKCGQPSTVVKASEAAPDTENAVNEGDMNASVSENIPLSDGSTVLVEVASDSSTYRYLIETQGALGESGSLSVAKDIANLFLATERCNQEMETVNEAGNSVEVYDSGDQISIQSGTLEPTKQPCSSEIIQSVSSLMDINAVISSNGSPEATIQYNILDPQALEQVRIYSSVPQQQLDNGTLVVQTHCGLENRNIFTAISDDSNAMSSQKGCDCDASGTRTADLVLQVTNNTESTEHIDILELAAMETVEAGPQEVVETMDHDGKGNYMF